MDSVIYLSSLGSLDIYPNNKPSQFTNQFSTPINLDNNEDYEIGIISMLFPKLFYVLRSSDEGTEITFKSIVTSKERRTGVVKEFVYKPAINILAGNMERIVRIINNDVIKKLDIYFADYNVEQIFNSKNNKLFRWDPNNIRINYTKRKKDSNVLSISLSLGPKIANILGFNENTPYYIYGDRKQEAIYNSNQPSPNNDINYLYVYTDIIQPAIFGGKLTNILDCFDIQVGQMKSAHTTVYRPLNSAYINTIAVYITDQWGRDIPFDNNTSITCILNIRKRR